MNPPSPEQQERIRQTMAALWERSLPQLRERLALLDAAVAAAAAGAFSREQRLEASATAHKIAGSVGMFGYLRAGEHARALEQRFEADGPHDPAVLHAHAAALRTELGLTELGLTELGLTELGL